MSTNNSNFGLSQIAKKAKACIIGDTSHQNLDYGKNSFNLFNILTGKSEALRVASIIAKADTSAVLNMKTKGKSTKTEHEK